MKIVIFSFFFSFLFVATVLGQDMPELEWAKSFGGWLGSESGVSTVVDSQGNIYVVGDFEDTVDFNPNDESQELTSIGGEDIFILKLSPQGNFVWVKQIGGEENDVPRVLTIDSNDNLIISGIYGGGTIDVDPGSGTHYLTGGGSFLLKTDSDGNLDWVIESVYEEGSFGVRAITTNSNNDIYIAGTFSGELNITEPLEQQGDFSDIFIAKLSQEGDFYWTKGIGHYDDDYANSIAIDSQNNILVTGRFGDYLGEAVDFDPGLGTYELTSEGFGDIFVLKLTDNGTFLWAKSMGSVINNESGTVILTDQQNNVYTVGSFYDTVDFNPNSGTFELTAPGSWDTFIQKLDSSGEFIWAKRIGGNNEILTWDFFIDSQESLYLSGRFVGTADFDSDEENSYELTSLGTWDSYILKISNNADFEWVVQFSGNGEVNLRDMTLDNQGSIITTGGFYFTADFNPDENNTYELISEGFSDIFVHKMSQPGLQTSDYILLYNVAVYPNPVQDQIAINNTSNSDITQVEIYNLLGAKVDEITINSLEAVIDVSTLKAGTYFFKIYTDGGGAITKKIIKR